MIFLGVDPGLSGAIAAVNEDDDLLSVLDMPLLKLKRGGAARNEIDVTELARLVDDLCQTEKVGLAVIEQAQTIPGTAMPRQALQTGYNFGLARGVVAAQFAPTETVPPKVWKRAMACPKEKDGARARASQLLPRHAGLWALKKHDGRAEAALIALYAARLYRKRAVTV
jgi:hypothetical protein